MGERWLGEKLVGRGGWEEGGWKGGGWEEGGWERRVYSLLYNSLKNSVRVFCSPSSMTDQLRCCLHIV